MSCLIDEKFDGGLKPACEDFLTQVLYILHTKSNNIFYNSFLKMTLIFFNQNIVCEYINNFILSLSFNGIDLLNTGFCPL